MSPTWKIQKNSVDIPDKKILLFLEQFIAERDLNEEVEGPEIVKDGLENIIKVKCSRRIARILVKAPGVLKLHTIDLGGSND